MAALRAKLQSQQQGFLQSIYSLNQEHGGNRASDAGSMRADHQIGRKFDEAAVDSHAAVYLSGITKHIPDGTRCIFLESAADAFLCPEGDVLSTGKRRKEPQHLGRHRLPFEIDYDLQTFGIYSTTKRPKGANQEVGASSFPDIDTVCLQVAQKGTILRQTPSHVDLLDQAAKSIAVGALEHGTDSQAGWHLTHREITAKRRA